MQKQFAPPVYFQPPNHVRIFSGEAFQALVSDSGLGILSFDQTGFFRVVRMSIYRAVLGADGAAASEDGALDRTEPPSDESRNRWAALWTKPISTLAGLAFKREMDQLVPKNQVIVARRHG